MSHDTLHSNQKGILMTYIKLTSKNKSVLLQSATVEQIQQHTQLVEQGLVTCGLSPCPRCGIASDLFKHHEKRKRNFFVIVKQVVETVIGLLSRWKCPGCNKTATDYPDFALPYKRYTLPTIQAFSQVYVQDPSASYRHLVDSCPLPYKIRADSDTGREPMMEHSTIHRWISTLGGYHRLVQNATDLMIQAAPTTNLCRDLAGLKVHPRKYMSLARKQTLFICFQLMKLLPIYQSIFQVSIFPKLATLSGYF